RSQNPVQPLTSGLWHHDDWSFEKLTPIEKIQIEQSDVISFHDYSWPEVFERKVKQLQAYGRPLLCTEYMARGNGSTFDGTLPLGKRYNVAMYTGVSSTVRRRRVCRGIPGGSRTRMTNRRSGSTK